MEQLLQPWVVDRGSPETEDHLSRKRICISSQVVDKIVGTVQESD